MQGEDLSKEDFAKRMVDMNQGTWKLSQLKKLTFEEIKEKFDKLVKQIDTFVPMGLEATKARMKRYSEELQTGTSKKQNTVDDSGFAELQEKVAAKDVPVIEEKARIQRLIKKKTWKQLMLSLWLLNLLMWLIGRYFSKVKEVYQIIRANGADTIYMSFGVMLKGITRDDLTELYRLVMQKYGVNRPEDVYEKRYYDSCGVDCLTLEATVIYMLTERKYPLSFDVCQAMPDMKLQGGKQNEECYQLLKLIEKQSKKTLP
ncbi:hypothetical protein Tco_1297648 [Tanacetum coccineum]